MQLSEQLEDVSGGSTNICPLLSLATLSTMSEGGPMNFPHPMTNLKLSFFSRIGIFD